MIFGRVEQSQLMQSKTNKNVFTYGNEMIVSAPNINQATQFANTLQDMEKKFDKNKETSGIQENQNNFGDHDVTGYYINEGKILVEYKKKQQPDFLVRAYLHDVKALTEVKQKALEYFYHQAMRLVVGKAIIKSKNQVVIPTNIKPELTSQVAAILRDEDIQSLTIAKSVYNFPSSLMTRSPTESLNAGIIDTLKTQQLPDEIIFDNILMNQAIISLLENNRSIKKLEILHPNFEDDSAVEEFFKILPALKLEKIKISKNVFTKEQWLKFCNILNQMIILDKIDFSDNDINSEILTALQDKTKGLPKYLLPRSSSADSPIKRAHF